MNQVVAFVFFTQISISIPQDIVFRDESYGMDVGCPCMNQFGNGLCVFPGNCRIALKDMHHGYPPICFFYQHRIPVVCCPMDKVISFWPVNTMWGQTTTTSNVPYIPPQTHPTSALPPMMYPSNLPPNSGIPPLNDDFPKVPSVPSAPSAPSVPIDNDLSDFPNLPNEPPNSLNDPMVSSAPPSFSNDFFGFSSETPPTATQASDFPSFPDNFSSILEHETTPSNIPVSSDIPNRIDGKPTSTERIPPPADNVPIIPTEESSIISEPSSSASPPEEDTTLLDDFPNLSNDLPTISNDEEETSVDSESNDTSDLLEPTTTNKVPWLFTNLDNVATEEVIIKSTSTTSAPAMLEEASESSDDIPPASNDTPSISDEDTPTTNKRPSLWDDILNIPTEEIIIRGPTSSTTSAPSTSDAPVSADVPAANDLPDSDLNIGEFITPSTQRNPLWDNILNIPTEEIVIRGQSSTSAPNEDATNTMSSSESPPNDINSPSTDIPLCINYIEKINVRFGEENETTPESTPTTSRKPLCFSPINTASAKPDSDDDDTDIPVRTDRLSSTKCKEYSQNYTTNNDSSSTPREFPHIAAIGVDDSDLEDGGIYFVCGGSLISERFVLTSATCFTMNSPDLVRLGAFDLTTGSDDGVTKDFGIDRVFIHPRYTSKAIYNDIALIRLDSDVQFQRDIRPACLNDGADSNGMGLATTGWGRTTFGNTQYDTLQKVPLTIVQRKACALEYPRGRQINDGIVKSLICAESNSDGKSPCQGDSGGPLAFYTYDSSISANIYYIVGITAHGKECGTKIPAIYTRVYSYLDWIEEIAFN